MDKLVANEKDIDVDRKEYYIKEIRNFDSDPDVKNVAVMGPYGSGKSTILQQLKKENPDKYIEINMIEFSDDVNQFCGDDLSIKIQKEEMVQKVENSILQQLIYQEDPQNLPFSKIKHEYPSKNNILKNIFLSIFLTFGIFLFCMFDLKKYITNFTTSFASIASLIFLVILIGIGVFLMFFAILYFYKNFRLVKINYSKKNTSLECERYESVYNKNIDELIYFFKESSFDTVIFEDIDRYNDLLFFSHLRELNALLNKTKTLNKMNKKITFIYAIRDDLFSEQDKSKFFDYIVPIIPIMDYSNSAAKFAAHLSGENIDNSTFKLLSDFVFDYRTLKNICNEYKVYKHTKTTEIYSENNLLSIITFKNLYPKEFAKLQHNDSILNYIFKKTSENLQLKINALQDKMDILTKALKDDYNFADPKYLVIGLIKKIIEDNKININNGYNNKITGLSTQISNLNNIFNCSVEWNEIEKIEQILIKNSYLDIQTIKLTEYQKLQFKHYKYLHDNKENLCNKTREELISEINTLDEKINELRFVKSSKFYSDNPEVLNNVINKYYEDIGTKELDQKFILFIKNLIFNDLIGENYNRYISLTYGKEKNENDNLFIYKVYAKNDNDFELKLNDIDYIYDQLKNDLYESRFSFNINVILYLARKNVYGLRKLLRINSDRLNKVYDILPINDLSAQKIILETLENAKDIENLIKSENKNKRDYWFQVLLLMNHSHFKKLIISDNLKNEISNYDLIKLSQIKEKDVNEFIDNCKGLDIKFTNIIGSEKNKYLFEAILDDNLFDLNYKNLTLINKGLDFEKFRTNVKSYIVENLDQFISILVVNNISTRQSEDFNQIVIRECKNRLLVCKYFKQNKVVLNNLNNLHNIEELLSLCDNSENTKSILSIKNLSKDDKSKLICELYKNNKDFINEYALDLCDTIKSEKLYTAELLYGQIYKDLLKLPKIALNDKEVIFSSILDICDKQNLLRLVKAFDSQFKKTKGLIVLLKNSFNNKLVEKLKYFRLFEIVDDNVEKITLKKIDGSDLPPIM